MHMNTTSLHIKIEPGLKAEAQRTADELGLQTTVIFISEQPLVAFIWKLRFASPLRRR